MKIYCFETKEEAGEAAAKSVANVIKSSSEAVLGLATGSSPIPMYNSLAKMYNDGELSFASVKSVNLDEYVGLEETHEQSYRYFMNDNLFNKVDINLENTRVPSGIAADLDAECRAYDAYIDSLGGIDVQILGIGHNGHIGFNEPAESFSKGTAVVTLTDSTVNANARFFASREEVPTRAISMGVGAIMKAKKIILLVNGSAKADILEKALFGDVTPYVPASILQFASDVEVYADREALFEIIKNHYDSVIFNA